MVGEVWVEGGKAKTTETGLDACCYGLRDYPSGLIPLLIVSQ